MHVMTIESNVRDYAVHFEEDAEFLKTFELFPERLFVVDSNVWKHYGTKFLKDLNESDLVVFPINEERKSLASVVELYDILMERTAKKNMT